MPTVHIIIIIIYVLRLCIVLNAWTYNVYVYVYLYICEVPNNIVEIEYEWLNAASSKFVFTIKFSEKWDRSLEKNNVQKYNIKYIASTNRRNLWTTK